MVLFLSSCREKQKATKNKTKKLLTKHLNYDSINELSLMRKQQRELWKLNSEITLKDSKNEFIRTIFLNTVKTHLISKRN